MAIWRRSGRARCADPQVAGSPTTLRDVSISHRDPYDAPSRRDRIVAVAARSIGGPAGRHLRIGAAGAVGVIQALTVMTAGIMALAIFQKGHCLANGWAHPDQFWRACYSDIPVLYVATPGLSDGALPYLDQPWDQPLLSGLSLWLMSWLTPGSGVAAQQWIFLLWALAALLLLILMIPALVSMLPQRPWHAAHLVLSPVLVVLALVSTDLVGIALAIWGLWCWRAHHSIAAGALLGAAVLVRPYPVLLLAAILLVALRHGRHGAAGRALAAAVVTPALLLVPLLLVQPDAVIAPLRTWWVSGPGYGAPALIPQLLGQPLTTVATSVIAAAGWVVALGLGWWLSRRPGPTPSAIRVAAPMIVIVALTAQSLPVQTGLWLLPVIALSGVRWRDHLIWAAVEIAHFVAVWLHIGFTDDPGRGLPPETYALATLARAAAWAYLAWRIWVVPVRRSEPGPQHRAPGVGTGVSGTGVGPGEGGSAAGAGSAGDAPAHDASGDSVLAGPRHS